MTHRRLRQIRRRPFPSKRDLAELLGVTEKAIQLNMAALEKVKIIRRELRRTPAGDLGQQPRPETIYPGRMPIVWQRRDRGLRANR